MANLERFRLVKDSFIGYYLQHQFKIKTVRLFGIKVYEHWLTVGETLISYHKDRDAAIAYLQKRWADKKEAMREHRKRMRSYGL